ncbi:MAG: serine/threonine protein kinase [Proteobacteria bacterium]|nr:serine/threonine protein kinase [Pseudomonadota bacterium]NOG60436.1 serine/threonine protein kinase [Pseudomonadota bacterium]
MEIPGYRIDKEIGKGGMATVYLAVQESLERSVVLKILDRVQRSASEEMTQRFVDEGRIVASLHHPNIVTIFDIGLAGEDLYISMEYVQGGDLKKRMESHVPAKVALDIISKIGSALDSAHAHNVIHRDVKPANILFRQDGTPLLTDFGIAKQTDFDKDLTSTGIFLGSPNYVSPEQADGKTVDGRSDIYSLGCILYEMLTGYKPYHSDSVIDIVIQHKTSPVPKLPEKFEIYQSLLNRMMAKNLDERFANAQEMLKSLEKLQALDDSGSNELTPDFDITGHTPKEDKTKKTMKKSNIVLISLLILSAIFFFGLQFVEIRLKSSEARIDKATTASALPTTMISTTSNIAQQTLETVNNKPITEENENPPVSEESDIVEKPAEPAAPASEQVTRALAWLGKQSLDEFKLTYPPKDNAYYYFSRLLELEPDNRAAYEGILAIAERYVILAERSLANNELEKTRTYIEIGLQIDPGNEALLSLQNLLSNQKTGFWQTLKSFF